MSVQHGGLQFNLGGVTHENSKVLLVTMVAVLSLSLLAGTVSAQEKWKPTKTISVIVPWPAGGASDTVSRMISGVMEQSIGQRMVIVNTPGGAGAIGTKEVWTSRMTAIP